MKKFLLVSILTLGIGTVTFAQSNYKERATGMHTGRYERQHGKNYKGRHKERCDGSYIGKRDLSYEQKKEFRKKIEANEFIVQSRIKLQENKTAMMKEKAKKTLNFEVIKKLQREKAIIEADIKTEKMKMMYEVEKTKN